MTDGSPKRRRVRGPGGLLVILLGVAAVLVFSCFGVCVGYPCFRTGLRYGMWIDQCPAGNLRLGAEVQVSGLVRGGKGTVSVLPYARYLVGKGASAQVHQDTLFRGAIATLDLLTSDEKHVGGLQIQGPDEHDGWRDLKVKLPDVPDGDYILRVTVHASFEDTTVDVDLPLYAPAIAYVMTDRPLYRPGQEVLLRSVTFKRTDLSPLEGRPGRWRITDPNGNEMMVEKDRAGPWGVADTTFPLDDRAPVGTWTAAWESGDAHDAVHFDVRPFRLPRFTVDASPSARWYGVGDTVRVDGVARYTSGAPVANAPVQVRLSRTEGRWPLPIAWEEPFTAKTAADGRFSVPIGRVPPDLIERNVVQASVRVTEAAGEVATGVARLVLSKDDLEVQAVTELGAGLVGGFNNRAYLRVATPDDQPVPNANVVVTNPWDPRAEPVRTKADADGVVAVQVDPGDPVTIVVPAPPVRVHPLVPAAPAVISAQEVQTGRSLDLAERRALDAASPAIARCGDLAPGGENVSVGVRVAPSGVVTDVVHANGALPGCVAAAARLVRFPPGPLRTYALAWRVPDSLVPTLVVSTRSAFGGSSGVQAAWTAAAREARRCVPRGTGVSGSTVLAAQWRVYKGSRAIEAVLRAPTTGTGLDAAQRACVEYAFTGLRLADVADANALGAATVTLSVPRPPGSTAPQPQTKTGYELKVAASVDGADIGHTNLVLPVGTIPPLRLRATPSLAHPGDTVTVEMFRGPSYTGDLPKKLFLMKGTVEIAHSDVDETKHAVKFEIPHGTEGFLHVDAGGARAVIFVRSPNALAVAVQPDQSAYRPGQTATLTVTTTAGDKPVQAGVGLVGVDSALAQLAPLLGPDAYGRVTVRATASDPAFGIFDPRSLALGQIHGENAAKAAVLRISQLPMDAAGDQRIDTSAASVSDDQEVLITAFYRVLEALHGKVRTWEHTAPKGQVMTPERMVAMWNDTLRDLRKAGEPAVDAYGRPLTLDLLPDDLLAQVDPRQVVTTGTRLPEDVVSWQRYVEKEVGR